MKINKKQQQRAQDEREREVEHRPWICIYLNIDIDIQLRCVVHTATMMMAIMVMVMMAEWVYGQWWCCAFVTRMCVALFLALRIRTIFTWYKLTIHVAHWFDSYRHHLLFEHAAVMYTYTKHMNKQSNKLCVPIFWSHIHALLGWHINSNILVVIRIHSNSHGEEEEIEENEQKITTTNNNKQTNYYFILFCMYVFSILSIWEKPMDRM